MASSVTIPITTEVTSADQVNILLVDDQPAKLMANESILADTGANIVKVTSGVMALQFLLKNDCAVIVMDVNMPGMDGFETASFIRQRPSLERTPIIFISAYSVSDIDRLKGYDVGAVDYLFVPVIPSILRAKVQVFVELFRQRMMIQRQAAELRKKAEQQEHQIQVINELNKRLRMANEDLESFSYSISHDLRSPIRTMRNYSDLILDECRSVLTSEAMQYLQKIQRACEKMDSLIQDVLDYSRLSKCELTPTRVDVEAVVRGIIEQSDKFRGPHAKVEVRSPLHPVQAHEACLAQCLANLMTNAVKFVARGKVPNVYIWTEQQGDRVKIWIRDNGIGIEPAHTSKIFQLFSRLHSDEDYEGTGVGLVIVKKGVERMGGRVGFQSIPGEGSQFWIEMPGIEPVVDPRSIPNLISSSPVDGDARSIVPT